MSAGAQSKTVAPISEVGSGLDLNLSLNFTTAALFQDQQRRQELLNLVPELESFDQQPGLNPAPAISPDQQVVDLKNLPTSDEVEDGGSENSSSSTTNRKRNLPDEPRQSLGENSKKKLRLSLDQAIVLEEAFKKHTSLNPRQKEALAKRLGLRKRQVEVWFQNRRARTKMKKTEVECEYMKQNFIGLIERVQRLQKEVSELRALNLPPQFYMQIPPATTWTFCPSCERVGIPTPAADPVNAGRVELHRNMGRLEAVSLNPWAFPGQMM